MEINYWAILVSAIASLILGSIWYGPLFGKAWMRIIKADPEKMKDPVYRKKMQKEAMPLYLLQFVMALFQVWVLAKYINLIDTLPAMTNALWIWAGFVLPTAAGASMWNNDSKRDNWQKFFLTAFFQLLLFVVFVLILTAWK